MSSETESPQSDTIAFDDFAKIKLRVGRVLEASDHPNADKLLVLKVDLGDETRQICAGLKGYYTPEELIGKNLVIVANLSTRMMRGEQSQGMLLAGVNDDRSRVIVVSPEADLPPGTPIS